MCGQGPLIVIQNFGGETFFFPIDISNTQDNGRFPFDEIFFGFELPGIFL